MTELLLAQVGSGRIQGGWGYVWAAYLLTWNAIWLYAVSLWLRRRASARASADPEPPMKEPS